MVTYRVFLQGEHHPYTEYTVDGVLGEPNSMGWVPIKVKGKVVATPHWTDIKGYFPEKGGGYF